jgi:hypothetical protein
LLPAGELAPPLVCALAFGSEPGGFRNAFRARRRCPGVQDPFEDPAFCRPRETSPNVGGRRQGGKGSFGVTLHFLEPFDPAALPGRKVVSAECRRRIAGKLSDVLGGVEVK